jgi:phosphatidylglycerol:prolipoprotein diacylglycerol transferase
MRFASPGPVALAVGPLTVRWYGLLLATAAVVGLLLATREAERRGLPPDRFATTCWLALAGGIVGARLYHVALNWEYFARAPARVLAVWEGGVAIFGAIVGGVLGALVYTRGGDLPLGRFLDTIAPSLALGQAIGRWGNFFNEEAFGRPTALPWGLYVSPGRRPAGFRTVEAFHPTFLYESAWNLGVFAILYGLLRKPLAPVPGALFLAYVGLYSLGRLPIEWLRLDSEMLGPFRSAHVMAGAGLLVSSLGLAWQWRARRAGVAGPPDRG